MVASHVILAGDKEQQHEEPTEIMDRGLMTPIATSRTLLDVAVYALLIGVYAVLPVLKELSRDSAIADLPAEIHAALTLVLEWPLVFRTSTAYAYSREARTL